MSWKEFTIGEVCQFVRNGKSIKQSSDAGGLPTTRIETIWDAEIDETKFGYANLTDADAGQYLLENGDILLSHINSINHMGKCAIYEGRPQKLVHGMNLVCLRPNQRIIPPKFFLYLLRTNYFIANLLSLTNKSVNQASISVTNLKSIKVEIPTLAEQQRIAAILDKADELCAKRRAVLAKLDTLLQATFSHMFGDPVTNPMGWEELTIEDCLNKGYILSVKDGNHGEIHPKVADFTNDGIPFVKASDINENVLDLSSCHRLPEVFQEKLRTGFSTAGDVLLSHKGSIGFTAIVPETIDLIILSPQVTYYRTNPKFILPEYLWGYFQTKFFQKNIENFAKQSTRAYVGITKQQLLPIVVPSLDLQLEYQKRLRKYDQIAMGIKHASKMQHHLFHTLQQRALKGEL